MLMAVSVGLQLTVTLQSVLTFGVLTAGQRNPSRQITVKLDTCQTQK